MQCLSDNYFSDLPNLCSTVRESLAKFRKQNKETGPPLRIHLDRMEGQLDSDILALYKNKDISLRRTPRVRFEGEPAVGSGPVSEFFTLSMKLLEEGFSLNEKVIVLEGEADHKVPIANTMLRKTGIYETFGKRIGHSILHGGPGVYGLSAAVIHYWAFQNDKENPPSYSLKDVADIELRGIITQVGKVDYWDNTKHCLLSIVYNRNCLSFNS